ncbi:RNA recognition motif-containing protein [Hydrogenophaga taeniospiralis CCUG 15921]|uniref:RNA recognition motif-containing protein n=1 Tax=Hydrogenophaga taeniospiralis CCUG 15921 TaxID=1281780 RepID=A0A9X4P131_9BURK|nr:RNA recognition motif-containing protein [Hydrogenophaga taeniospiralis CCUG 15921]
MGNKLYVGNLPYTVRDEDLQQAFSAYGSVNSAKVMMERDTGRSKGFGFVEMGSDAEAQAAVEGMNGQSLGGRSLVVNEARPMEARPPPYRWWRLRRWPQRWRRLWWRWRQRRWFPQPLRRRWPS